MSRPARRPALAALATAATALGASVLLATPGAAAANPVMTVNPTSGPAGTAVQVSADAGNGCGSPDGGSIDVTLVRDSDQVAVGGGSTGTDPNQSSWPWSVGFNVPADAVPGAYTVNAHCMIPGGSMYDYVPVAFQVTGQATTTTTSTSTTTTTAPASTTTTAPSTTATTVVAAMGAAAPVSGTPAFTG